jgi:hypothetical protein
MPLPRYFGLLCALVFVTRYAFAQTAPTPEEVQQAQARWSEGKAFFDAGNFEAARVAFKQAYTVFPHPVFLQNLGEAELRSGRNVEAARHFEAFLRTSSSSSGAQRELARKSLRKAAEKLGSVLVSTNAEDAEIRVDDEVVGRSPLGGLEWYVEPGKHVVVARKEGYLDGSEQVFVPAGRAKTVVVRVQRVAAGTEDPTSAKVAAPRAPQNAAAAAPEDQGDGIEPRTWVVAGGVALTAVALTVGTVYALRGASDQSHMDDARARIAGNSDCGLGTAPADACSELARYAARWPTDRNVRNASFVAAGALGAATVATYFLWPPPPKTTARATPTWSPWLGSGQYGLFVSGRF